MSRDVSGKEVTLSHVFIWTRKDVLCLLVDILVISTSCMTLLQSTLENWVRESLLRTAFTCVFAEYFSVHVIEVGVNFHLRFDVIDRMCYHHKCEIERKKERDENLFHPRVNMNIGSMRFSLYVSSFIDRASPANRRQNE